MANPYLTDEYLQFVSSEYGDTVSWDVIDRCGAGRFSTGDTDPFLEECVIHDHLYLKGGPKAKQKEADGRFYKGVWTKAMRNPLLIPRALLYSTIVRALGGSYWQELDRSGVLVRKITAHDAQIRFFPIELVRNGALAHELLRPNRNNMVIA